MGVEQWICGGDECVVVLLDGKWIILPKFIEFKRTKIHIIHCYN
ncbi:hypothetical protein GPUN_0126 [Glaciecola punicea ACAM 611]|uniref:Uncharacterized protein n=1 Tax=Glaciecola punicea ACAM 611 TaxID=1121923 RepID=H5T7K3_9ALTE|nr:hypothetical protein GPUN_0126 [Glaciecola punicea ACAM 611]